MSWHRKKAMSVRIDDLIASNFENKVVAIQYSPGTIASAESAAHDGVR